MGAGVRQRGIELGVEPLQDLPGRAGARFELALASYEPRDQEMLEAKGWQVRDALGFSKDLEAYRTYITGSRGEFTVAKDQNVRLRTGWFSDRSATYLAAGRPVVTQETGFSDNLPTGAGLFGVSDLDEAVEAISRIEADYEGQRQAAFAIAREYFDAQAVLGQLLEEVGLGVSPNAVPASIAGILNALSVSAGYWGCGGGAYDACWSVA